MFLYSYTLLPGVFTFFQTSLKITLQIFWFIDHTHLINPFFFSNIF